MTIHVTWTGILALIGAGTLVFLVGRYVVALVIYLLFRWG